MWLRRSGAIHATDGAIVREYWPLQGRQFRSSAQTAQQGWRRTRRETSAACTCGPTFFGAGSDWIGYEGQGTGVAGTIAQA